MYVKYSSNNYGCGWWLQDKDWKALEAAGWKVAWASLEHKYTEEGNHELDTDGTPLLVPVHTAGNKFKSWAKPDANGTYRYLGAIATEAYRTGLSLEDAIAEWRHITMESPDEPGCSCCGQPHNFYEYGDNDRQINYGPSAVYEDDED